MGSPAWALQLLLWGPGAALGALLASLPGQQGSSARARWFCTRAVAGTSVSSKACNSCEAGTAAGLAGPSVCRAAPRWTCRCDPVARHRALQPAQRLPQAALSRPHHFVWTWRQSRTDRCAVACFAGLQLAGDWLRASVKSASGLASNSWQSPLPLIRQDRSPRPGPGPPACRWMLPRRA